MNTMMDYPLTLDYILDRAGKFSSDRPIVSRMPDKSLHRYTYKEMVARSRQLASALTKLGLQKSERVGTLMWNHYAHMESYFGIPVAGGILHTLNLRLHPDDIAYIANHAEDRFIIVDDVLLPLFEKFADKLEKCEKVIVVPLTGAPVDSKYLNYEELLATGDANFVCPKIDEADGAGMCYTSGTTGHPKGVIYSHRSMVLHSFASALTDILGLSHHDSMCPVVPMFHVNAWGLPFTGAMIGTKMVFPGPFMDPQSLLDLYAEEEVTLTAGVPTIWMGILQALEKNPDQWKLKNMRMVVGGSAAPESMIRAFDRLGHRVVHAWGMTETAPLGSVCNLTAELSQADEDTQYAYRAKQGQPVPFVEIRAMGENGEAAWNGKDMGELQVRGPWIAKSYYNLPAMEDKFTADGWFATGDIVTIDERGYIKITDRSKDLIKSGGEWISSVDLETQLMNHEDVAEAAVVAIPHPKWAERPLAFVVKKEGKEVTPEALKEYLLTKVAKWWVPESFVFLDQIPRTSAGKFLKSKLREDYKDWKWDS